MKRLCIFGSVALLLALSAPASAALLNGDMEATTSLAIGGSHTETGRVTGWTMYDGCTSPSEDSLAYGVATSGSRWTMTMPAYSGKSAFIQHKGNRTDGGYWGIYQTVDTTPGVEYTISSMVNSMANSAADPTHGYAYWLFVTDGPGFVKPDNTLAYAGGQSGSGTGGVHIGSTSGWESKSTTFTATATQTTFAWISWTRSDASLSKGQILGIDNVVLTPEPATLLLLGFGGLFLRRRRQAA